jgi:hypothetical protein
MQGSKRGRNARPRGQLGRLVQMAAKIKRLARNGKLGGDAAITSLGNSSAASARRAPEDGRSNQRKRNRNEPRPRGPSRLDRRMARRGRGFRYQRGSYRLHCQPRPARDQSLRYPRGRKRRSGSFTIDKLHGQLIFGVRRHAVSPASLRRLSSASPAPPTPPLQDGHPDNWLANRSNAPNLPLAFAELMRAANENPLARVAGAQHHARPGHYVSSSSRLKCRAACRSDWHELAAIWRPGAKATGPYRL